ncbi:MAG: hypothetical protein IJI73_08280 [Kiritimatiellae bacterium]|nr:hypothetical protein [Kiritimatiellia bacterium]
MKHAEGSGSILKSRLARGMFPLMAAFLACALAAPEARGEVLVYEGFHPEDYNNVGDNTQMTPSNANVSNNHSVGLATGAWSMNGTQPKVYGANYGLTLPSAMTDAGFAVLGGSIGLNPGENNKALRSASHGLVAGTLNVSSGSLYVRALLNLDSKAATKLVAGESLAQKDGGYFGFGLTTGTTDYYLLTASKSSIAFVVWKNSSNQYVLSLVHTTASGTAFTSYPLITDITLGTTYICYAEVQVGAGAGGKEIIRAGAMAADAYTTDTPWAMIGGESDTVEVELMTASSYPTCIGVAGPYGTKDGSNGYFRADELVVGTELSDILLATTTKPKLSNGALSLANGTYAVSASLANSAADVSYVLSNGTTATTNAIAAYADGDTVAGTFAAPTDDTTYEVLLVAENTGGETAELSLGTIYGGTLSLTKVSDGSEVGLAPATLTVSRVNDDPLPLVVNYSFADGTAVAGVNYVDDAGSVTIPAGQTSATIVVHPLVDVATAADTAMSVSLAAGNYNAPAAGVAVTIANFTTPAGLDYWVGSTATDGEYLASNGDNWSLGRAPNATETAVFDGDFSTIDCTWDAAAPHTVGSWLQTNAYTGSVVFKTTFAEADAAFTEFTISGDAAIAAGYWTLPTATSSQTARLYRIKVSVGGALRIASGASITVSGKAPWSTVSGCAYGGSCDSSSAYGNVLEPADPGQSWPIPGGATGEYLHPAFGGGAIWLEVAGATTLDGTILANGGYCKGWDAYYGSGGGIYLKTASLVGSGTISADGNSTGGSNGGNASAGGRISILLTGAAEMALPLANVHALGSSEYAHQGGAGTVVVRTTSLTRGRLVVRNLAAYGQFKYYPPKERTTPVLAGETWTFDEIVFGANGVLRVPEGTTLSLPNGLASVSGSSDLGANRGFCGILLDGGTLDVADTAATEHVVGNGQWMLSPNAPLVLNGSLTVQGGASVGAIRLRNESTNSFTKMELTVKGNMTVASDGYILTEGAGLTGSDAKSLFDGTTYGAHGGAVGCTGETAAPVDVAYDSILSPSLPGNRGSSTYRYGSGVALLTVKGSLTLDGTASADAIGGHWHGAPGTINITAGSLAGSGKITANGNQGGQWDADNNYHLYPGGGRVSVRLTDNGATFSEAWMANIQARGVSYMGGGSNDLRFHHSTAGTVYLQDGKQKEGAGVVRIFQNNATVNWTTVCTNDFTAFPSTRHGGENDDLRKVSLEIGGGAHVFVTVDRARAGSISIAEHSTLDLNGKTLTVRTAKLGEEKLVSGTYTVDKLGGYVVDSATGGALVVRGGGFAVVVR